MTDRQGHDNKERITSLMERCEAAEKAFQSVVLTLRADKSRTDLMSAWRLASGAADIAMSIERQLRDEMHAAQGIQRHRTEMMPTDTSPSAAYRYSSTWGSSPEDDSAGPASADALAKPPEQCALVNLAPKQRQRTQKLYPNGRAVKLDLCNGQLYITPQVLRDVGMWGMCLNAGRIGVILSADPIDSSTFYIRFVEPGAKGSMTASGTGGQGVNERANLKTSMTRFQIDDLRIPEQPPGSAFIAPAKVYDRKTRTIAVSLTGEVLRLRATQGDSK